MSTTADESDAAERLAALRDHPGLDAALQDLPAFGSQQGDGLRRVLLLVGWCLGCIALAIATGMFFAPGALLPLALGVAGVYVFVRSERDEARYARAPVEAFAAVVTAERTQVVPGAGGQTDTAYVLVLETEDGPVEQVVEDALVGRVQVGSAGVAYRKANRLVAFRALPA